MTCPELLYKYRNFDTRTLELILENKIYFSDPNDFNDPLEFQPELILVDNFLYNSVIAYEVLTKNQVNKNYSHHKKNYPISAEFDLTNTRLKIEEIFSELPPGTKLKDFITDQLKILLSHGVLSLSKNKTSSLMWSHYANEHYGLCLGYSIPKDKEKSLHPIDYKGNRFVHVDEIFCMLQKEEREEREIALFGIIKSALLTKSYCWEYEDEYRLLEVTPGVKDVGLILREIIFGLRMKKSVRDAIINAVKNSDDPRLSDVTFYKMEILQPGGFELYPVPILD